MLEALDIMKQKNGFHLSWKAVYGFIQRPFHQSVMGSVGIASDLFVDSIQGNRPLNLALDSAQIAKTGVHSNPVHPADKSVCPTECPEIGKNPEKNILEQVFRNFSVGSVAIDQVEQRTAESFVNGLHSLFVPFAAAVDQLFKERGILEVFPLSLLIIIVSHCETCECRTHFSKL